MTRCKHCGSQINAVNVNFFRMDGTDRYVLCGFKEHDSAVELDVDRNWTGYDLTESEQFDTIKCPNCGRFPF